jgi:uncharacterized protein YqeY
MSLVDTVSSDMKDAMRARDSARLTTLRAVRAAFLNAMKSDGSESITDEAAVAILRKQAKQRLDSMEAFEKAERDDLYQIEKAELAVIETYLPSLADADQTRSWVEAAIAATGASSPKEMGRVMGAVMKEHRAEVDGNIVRKIATELLAAQ